MAKKITLREIAALTGTSVSTVSKALNQSPEISENTRRRIIEVARVSHYRAGQQLDIYRDGHQQMIGFLVPDVSNPYFARLWQGVEDIAICRLNEADVVRHVIVQRIIKAYEEDEHRRTAKREKQ